MSGPFSMKHGRGGLSATIGVIATMIVMAVLTAAAPPTLLVIVSVFTAGVVFASAILHRLQRSSSSSERSDSAWAVDKEGASDLVSRDSMPKPGRAMPVLTSYVPLNAYLEHRYTSIVVLTFEQIESLLGFSLPASANTEREWWTNDASPSDGHANTWTAAGRTATPNFLARNVAFIRP